jgi:lipoprotein-releasing system ATP-binding protein
MIHAKNLHKYYDQLHVLKGVDLHIKQGEIVSIVGAGQVKPLFYKSLELRQTFGRRNRARINKSKHLTMNDKSLSKFRNLNLSFIFQFHQLLPEFTALENVCIPAFIANKPEKETGKCELSWIPSLEPSKAGSKCQRNSREVARHSLLSALP